MNYWLDLFTGTTWEEFRKAGANISGFRQRMKRVAQQVKPADILLCYLTGVMRWVGALEVIGPTDNHNPIWKDEDFPVRFEVRPLVMLAPEHGVLMDELQGRVAFYATPKDKGKFRGFVRMSPNLFRRVEDGALVLDLLRRAHSTPVARPVDPKKLAYRPALFRAQRKRGGKTIEAVVSVPEPGDLVGEVTAVETTSDQKVSTTRHTEIQYQLLKLGTDLGLDVWVARNDRSKTWDGQALGNMPRMLTDLPTQFNEATTRTIELIDVLWLKGNTIVAAFEVECTTSVYSGLLRMSDLLALQPNLDIKLYLVAPDERRAKVAQEILRPTFSLPDRPLHEACGFLSFSSLMDKVDGIRKLGLASSLKPDFLRGTAEFFGKIPQGDETK